MEEPGRLQSMGLLSRARLRDFTFTFHFHALEKEMATHSSILAWKIPWTEEPGGLQSMGVSPRECAYPAAFHHLALPVSKVRAVLKFFASMLSLL